MFLKAALTALSFLAVVSAQQVGNNTAETHPKLSWQKCTESGGCVTQFGAVVLDSNWRWTHTTTGYTNCYTGNEWNSSLCPDGATCAQNCALEGADYPGTYGVTTGGNALTLKYVTFASQKNVGSRLYLLNSDGTQYEIFKLVNQEFTFDVDVSQLPC
ncbi:Exoglucanase, partial [Termitomyces sp. Mi166